MKIKSYNVTLLLEMRQSCPISQTCDIKLEKKNFEVMRDRVIKKHYCRARELDKVRALLEFGMLCNGKLASMKNLYQEGKLEVTLSFKTIEEMLEFRNNVESEIEKNSLH